MLLNIVYVIFCAALATAVQLPFLPNTILVPKFNVTSVTLTDRSCDQCLCEANSSHSILNCFPNNTCQFFVDFPRTYALQPTPNALLYFPRQILPNVSQCCMPNISSLLDHLTTTPPTYADVPAPLCLLIDSNGYLVTVSLTNRSIFRFHPKNLTRIDQPASPLFSDEPITLAHHNGAYYVGFDSYILAVHSSNMTILHTISTTELNGTRDMIFLNDGQQMIVASTFNNRLLFFNRSGLTSYDYVFVRYQDVSCHNPHGLFYINDGMFYLTSWGNNTVYTSSNPGNTTVWSEALILNAPRVDDSAGASHVSIDDCGRYWLSLGSSGTQIFSSQGSPSATLYSTGAYIFDTLLLDNYVLHLSDNTGNRTIRLDPNIQC